ncbi:cation:proton antiporter [Candidatus Uhrbacteria bacterium]|nr:cation:proton antiporter [Candidatus Uhrbacteria bacterium]
MTENIFFQISILLGLTVSIALVMRLLRQPLVISYIIAGVIAGPMFFNLLHGDKKMYEAFAQFGVVLLLFIIGLELNFRHLKSIGRISIASGFAQVLFTSALGMIILRVLGLASLPSLYLAVAATFSSTVIISKLLADKKETETVYGRHTIGLMLVQDVIAVLIMVFIGVLKGGGSVAGSAFLLGLGGVAGILTLIFLSQYILPWLLGNISHSNELLFLFTVSWCFGVASLVYWLGFSVEIGAIAAGIALSSSPYQPEISSRIKPLRDFFLILFFIVLGSETALSAVESVWPIAAALSLFILIGNPLILFFVFRLSKFTRRNSLLIGLTAAQVSEFGFVLLFTGQQIGHVDPSIISIFTIVAIVTIMTSSYLVYYGDRLYQWLQPLFRWFGPDRYRQPNAAAAVYDIWVVGHHRIGSRVCQALKALKANFSVIDYDPDAIRAMREQQIPSIFGDVADIEFLEQLRLASARLVIMTIPSVDDQVNLIEHVRRLNPRIMVLGNAYQKEDASTLYEAGADYVMMPHAMGADWIVSTLKQKKLTKKFFSQLRSEQSLYAS